MFLEHSAVVRRSPDDVFAFMDDVENQVRVTPGVSSAADVRRLDNGGLAGRVVYRVLGFELSQALEAVVYEPPRRLEYEVRGPITARLIGRYLPHPSGTELRLGVDYELPEGWATSVLARVANRVNAWALKTMVEGMRRELEADKQDAAPVLVA